MAKKEKIVCSGCGISKEPSRDFYSSTSPFHKHTGRLHVCKDCFWNYVEDDVEKFKNGLRMIDKPFLSELLKSSIDEGERQGKHALKIYMKNVMMPQYRGHTWADSDNKKENYADFIPNELVGDTPILSDDEKNYLMSFWGKGYQMEDLIWLQTEYEDWTNRYECDSKGMETLIQEICKQQLDINTRRSNGEKVDQQLKTLQDLLGSSNLKPVQETGANAAEQESFGTLLKKYENEKPVPEPDPRWNDVDNIGKYVRVFFLGHLTRMLGLKNDYADEYWDEVNKYTIEEPTEDEEDDVDNGIV